MTVVGYILMKEEKGGGSVAYGTHCCKARRTHEYSFGLQH